MIEFSGIDVPIANKIPKKLKKHDDIRIDNYFWMNDREHPEVISYLKDENAYADRVMAKTKAFQTHLFEEMKARIKEDDSSVPYKYNGYWYITKFEKGKDYPIYTRKKEHLEAEEELLFDCNEMAKTHSYFKLVGISISPDNTKVAFGLDTTGRRNYTIHIKDLITDTITDDKIEQTTGSSSWANDNKTLFYTKKDKETLRAYQIYKHKLGAKTDHLVFEETDDTFGVAVYKSKSRKYIIIACYSTLTNEYHILNADKPDDSFKLFSPRIRGLEYSISHYETHFYILTNKDNATNFKLMKTSEEATEVSNWDAVIPHRTDTLLESIDIFKSYLVLGERTNGLNQIRIIRWDNTVDYYLPFSSETYTCYTSTNVDFNTEILRYGYNSMTTPASIIDFNMATKTQTILKEQEVLGGHFNKENYTEERLWATADDGTKIPMSIVYKKGIKKENTFSDFIACSNYLIDQNYTSPKHLYAMGGSAGGLLMGAVINMAGHLYNGVISAVPFVDVISTMLDDSIPLTTGEYDEWGNPNDKTYYDYIKSYSPYDNVEAKDYPNMLVTSGLHDSQVQYWEPTKWVAKLRALKTDHNILLLRTNMDAGHGGASGRFESLKEDAEEFAFILALEGITE